MGKIMPEGKIVILSPTEAELRWCGSCGAGVAGVTGIGPVEAAAGTLRLLLEHRPSLAILAGIAGVYPGAELSVGDVVLVSDETTADAGTFSGGAFEPKFAGTVHCVHIPAGSGLRVVASNTVSAAGAPFISAAGAAIENMEGAAFFRICEEMGVPFLEIRAVSNIVGELFEQWNIPLALENLSRELKVLIKELTHHGAGTRLPQRRP